MGVQLLGIGVTIVLAVSITYIICVIVDKTVGLRIDEQSEREGLDQALHGEKGYGLTSSVLNQ